MSLVFWGLIVALLAVGFLWLADKWDHEYLPKARADLYDQENAK